MKAASADSLTSIEGKFVLVVGDRELAERLKVDYFAEGEAKELLVIKNNPLFSFPLFKSCECCVKIKRLLCRRFSRLFANIPYEKGREKEKPGHMFGGLSGEERVYSSAGSGVFLCL